MCKTQVILQHEKTRQSSCLTKPPVYKVPGCLFSVCAMKSPTMSDYLTGLENSGWLRHIKAVMDAGVFLAKVIDILPCSDLLSSI